MITSPEIQFHLLLKNLPPKAREKYKGKYDLEALEPIEFRNLLREIQKALNEALAMELQIQEHVEHPRFHVDFIDSTIPDATAFSHEEYCFIGITVPLIYELWGICSQIANFENVQDLLGIRHENKMADQLALVLFHILLFFIVTHEYTHHVHGHITASDSADVFLASKARGLSAQALEIDADAYATFHVMGNSINGSSRAFIVSFLGISDLSNELQDQAIFSSFLVVVAAYLLSREQPFSVDSIYLLPHPLKVARVDKLVKQAIRWCNGNHRSLAFWMTADKFRALVSPVARIVCRGNEDIYQKQTEFLNSQPGHDYLRELDEAFRFHVTSL